MAFASSRLNVFSRDGGGGSGVGEGYDDGGGEDGTMGGDLLDIPAVVVIEQIVSVFTSHDVVIRWT